MKTPSGISSGGYSSPAASPADTGPGGTAVAPAPDGPAASFDDVLQQQTGGSSPAPSGPMDWLQLVTDLAGKAAATMANSSPTATPAAPATSPAPAPNAAAGPAVMGKDILPQETSAPPASLPQAPAPPAKADSAPLYTGAATFMAHAVTLAAQARHISTARDSSSGETPADPASESPAETAAETTASLADALGFGFTLSKSAGKLTSPSTMEKKSDASGAGGSFLQVNTSIDPSNLLLAGTLVQITSGRIQDSVSQPVTGQARATGNALAGVTDGAAGLAGTENGKKEKEMNATLELPNLVVTAGINPMVTRTSADVNIQLGSNQNFKDALTQVMHVAELSGMSNSTPPLRVAIEIQTPPGAIVNVYVSRQDDGYRAQLSASDPQALAYVQDQINSLRQSTDSGVAVRWLPAQLESSSASVTTSSSSSESNLSWDRGGQGQSGNQPGDDRQQAPRHKRPLFNGLLTPVSSSSFLDAVGVFGEAA